MSDQIRGESERDRRRRSGDVDIRVPDVSRVVKALPPWIAKRFEQEEICWVRGPRSGGLWERCFTHPALFLAGLALSVACFYVGRQFVRSWRDLPSVAAFAGILCAIGSLMVLAYFNGYFTRLVVTSRRVVILQGTEVCRSWRVDQLPANLLRERRNDDDTVSKTVDLEAMEDMLGPSSGHFVDSKSIHQFRKRIEQIRKRKKRSS